MTPDEHAERTLRSFRALWEQSPDPEHFIRSVAAAHENQRRRAVDAERRLAVAPLPECLPVRTWSEAEKARWRHAIDHLFGGGAP